MRPIKRALVDSRVAAEAAGRAFLEGTPEEWLCAARDAGLAAVRADRAAFGDDDAARLVDARERARANACALRRIAEVVALHPQAVNVPSWPILKCADKAEVAVAGTDVDAIYDAAILADRAAGFMATLFHSPGELTGMVEACREHRHHTEADTNDADAAFETRCAARSASIYCAEDIKRPLDLVRTCCRKRRFPTEDEAGVEAERLHHERGVRLRVYSCPLDVCSGWHLAKERRLIGLLSR